MTINRSRRQFLGRVAVGGASIVATRPAAATPQVAAVRTAPVTADGSRRPRRHTGADGGLSELAGAGRP